MIDYLVNAKHHQHITSTISDCQVIDQANLYFE